MKIILHNNPNLKDIEERRLQEEFALTPEQRIKRMFQLMKMAMKFKSNQSKCLPTSKITLILK